MEWRGTRHFVSDQLRFMSPDNERFNAAFIDLIAEPRAHRRFNHAARRDGHWRLDDVVYNKRGGPSQEKITMRIAKI